MFAHVFLYSLRPSFSSICKSNFLLFLSIIHRESEPCKSYEKVTRVNVLDVSNSLEYSFFLNQNYWLYRKLSGDLFQCVKTTNQTSENVCLDGTTSDVYKNSSYKWDEYFLNSKIIIKMKFCYIESLNDFIIFWRG